MRDKEMKKEKPLTVVIDKSLDKYKGVILFPEKLAKAKEVLKRMGIPKLDKK